MIGDLFSHISLTPAGRPLLREGEIEKVWVDDVIIQTDQRKDIFPKSSVLVTNVHIMVILSEQNQRGAKALHIKNITNIEDCATMFRSSKRIRIFASDGHVLELKFLSGKKEIAMDMIQKSLERKAWEDIGTPPASTKPVESQFSVRAAGVSGLIRRQERDHDTADAVAKEALTDLDALMRRAKDLIGVIDRYTAVRFNKSDDQSDTSSELGPLLLLSRFLSDPPRQAMLLCSREYYKISVSQLNKR
jgi:hypothetical protein